MSSEQPEEIIPVPEQPEENSWNTSEESSWNTSENHIKTEEEDCTNTQCPHCYCINCPGTCNTPTSITEYVFRCPCHIEECPGDCGTLWCGCIDVCRGRCGFSNRR